MILHRESISAYQPFRWSRIVLVTLSLLGLGTSFSARADEDDFDRLDGTGASKMKVDVIEWEGNLELHFYPKGRMQGVGFKIDRTKKDKPVMVIAYRFSQPPGRILASTQEGAPGHPIIRRAILGVSLHDDFKVYRDPEPTDYDKIIVTNNALSSPMIAFHPDVAPKQLYPDGHPMNGDAGKSEGVEKRKVASGQIDLVPPENKGVFTKQDGVNPEVKEIPRSTEKTAAAGAPPSQERGPATGSRSKFQNNKIDENTSGDIKVQEINLDTGFHW